MQKVVIIILCLLSESLFAQNASDVVPINKEIKDTTRQTDLIDVAKDVFHIKSQRIRQQGEKKIYFVAETKDAGQELRGSEKMKIDCGIAHFKVFDDVVYKTVSSVIELTE